jgi:hypothetical protein
MPMIWVRDPGVWSTKLVLKLCAQSSARRQ